MFCCINNLLSNVSMKQLINPERFLTCKYCLIRCPQSSPHLNRVVTRPDVTISYQVVCRVETKARGWAARRAAASLAGSTQIPGIAEIRAACTTNLLTTLTMLIATNIFIDPAAIYVQFVSHFFFYLTKRPNLTLYSSLWTISKLSFRLTALFLSLLFATLCLISELN